MRRALIPALIAFVLVPSAFAKSLDRVSWGDRAAWNCVKTIALRPFAIAGEFKGPKTEDEYMAYFAARLSSALVRPGGIEKVTLLKKDEPAAGFDAVFTG